METYYLIWKAWFVVAAVIALFLLFVRAPYGRHISGKWGPTISNHMGWVVMELPLLLFLTLYFLQGYWDQTALRPGPWQWFFYLLIAGHYIYRTFLFPLRIRTNNKRMPWVVVVFGIMHNWGNGYLNGYYLSHADHWSWQNMLTAHAFAGLALFVAGFAMHYTSDGILIRLRQPGETGYKIPHGGMYRYVSCPNYLGELLEWLGFALLTMSPGAWAFLVFTAANLVPRAIANHKWYRKTFPDYPPDRKAILPGLF